MIWKIKTKEQDLELSGSEVLSMLVGQLIKQDRPEQELLSLELTRFLQAKQTLDQVPISHLVYMAFQLGYLYRVLLQKNSVTVENHDTAGNEEHDESND